MKTEEKYYENKPDKQQRRRIDLRFARALGRQEARTLGDDRLRPGHFERASCDSAVRGPAHFVRCLDRVLRARVRPGT